MKLALALFVDSKNGEQTTLQENDVMVVQDVGTVGFHRGGHRLVDADGDDKVYIPNEAVNGHARTILSHFGIGAELVTEGPGVKAYRLYQRKSG